MINQWEKIGSLNCEYTNEILCISTGEEILNDLDLGSVFERFYFHENKVEIFFVYLER
jgi:hypothetical protein